jgi:AraC family transcriptional regulator of adaptative response/methylated-DNA-[protein]-cysteine methyltransferase
MMQSSEEMTQRTRRAPAGREPIDAETAWAAVQARDPRFDGLFVYAVRSTGVFCRPTCPSRRPGRGQVAFFAEAPAARAAGFRACRRCHPEDPGGLPARAALERVRAHIEAHLDERLPLQELARVAERSPTHLQRSFKAAFGLSPREYVKALRTERFKSEVRAGRSVTDALYEAGYGSGSRLYEDADDRLGMTPGAFKRGGAGQVIRYTTGTSALGRIVVAATERGICAVQLADTDGALEQGLRHDYPRAELRRDDKALAPTLAAILAHLGGAVPALDLPLDVTGTDFQGRVWHALRDIPPGETRSYAQVAQAVGRPRAVRAVARACASNRVALLIPCHRVVRGDGSSGGYRWGIRRKQRLLEQEKERREKARGARAGR